MERQTGKKLIELRSTGRQTLVAPSTHPSGEAYAWHRESGLGMAEVGAEELKRACKELATATLLALHLPPIRNDVTGEGGGRHDYAMAAAGFFLRPGRLGEPATLKILKAAWDARGWPDERLRRKALRDLEGIVRDTAQDLRAEEAVTGGPTLEGTAPGVVGLLMKWWDWNRDGAGVGISIDHEAKEEQRNQADRLIRYAREDVQALFCDQHGAPHALVAGTPLPLTSRCHSWLRRLVWEKEEKAVNGEYLKTGAGTLAAHAEFSGEVRELHTRVAWYEGALHYELGPGRVVRVSAEGWDFEPHPPVLFRRFPNLKPLPDPEPSASMDTLYELLNLKTDRDRRLFAAYVVTVPLPHVGRPILNAAGAMGSGKTTVGRVVKRLWDPTAPEAVRLDPRDFLQKAAHAYVVMLDNQNALPEWAADTLCRLVTGEADSRRRLYTDDEDVIIELRRAVLLNGINVPTDRGDVLDRSLVVELERIPDGERKTEEELWKRFGFEHSRLLGAAFGMLSQAIARKPLLELSRRPRLADWGEYAAAVYEVMGWGAEQFLSDWAEVVNAQNQATLDGSPVAQTIIKFMEEKAEYEASSSKLHGKLEPVAESIGVSIVRDKAWPKSARWLWKRIKEVLPLLAAAGIQANRSESKDGSRIALRKTSTGDATNATQGEKPASKPKSRSVKGEPDATSDATSGNTIARNTTRETNEKADSYASSSEGGISGIGDETSSSRDDSSLLLSRRRRDPLVHRGTEKARFFKEDA